MNIAEGREERASGEQVLDSDGDGVMLGALLVYCGMVLFLAFAIGLAR
jgi:hypothetical protein